MGNTLTGFSQAGWGNQKQMGILTRMEFQFLYGFVSNCDKSIPEQVGHLVNRDV